MRLAFPNGEHDEVAVTKGTLTIGSASGDDVVLEAEGVNAGHAMIIVDRRGITLNVDGAAGGVTVNGRPVVEKAILRLGDRLEIGSVPMVLCSELGQLRPPPATAGAAVGTTGASPKYHLRGLAGDHQGRIIALNGELSLGPGEKCDVIVADAGPGPELARFQVAADGVYLRSAGSQELEINGHRVSEVVLNPGDQLTFGAHRFLLETPSFVPGKAYAGTAADNHGSNTQVFASPVLNEQPAAAPAAREAGFTARASSRDAIVVAVCVLLSAAMLIWLFFLS